MLTGAASIFRRRALRLVSAAQAILSGLLIVAIFPASGLQPTAASPMGPSLPQPAPAASLPAASQWLPAADPPLNCRYGAAIIKAPEQTSWLSTLGAGWYVDFESHAPSPSTSSEYVQMIWVFQLKNGCTYQNGYKIDPPLTEAGLGSVISSHPGALWLVGNEPDRGPNPDNCLGRGQGDAYPDMYAKAYHDVYQFIKAHDPAALVGNAGLVQVTPGRLQYLDKVWAAYAAQNSGAPMPVDVWNMHLYVLPETTPAGLPNSIANVALGTDPALGKRESGGDPSKCADPKVYCFAEHDDMTVFAEQVVAMRTWMKQHQQQDKPLILSEYSILYQYVTDPGGTCYLQDEYGNCFTPDRVSTFMQRTFDYLESTTDSSLGYPADGYRLVQRWNWFSLKYSGAGSVSSLLAGSPLALTQQGQLFRTNVISRSSYVNLAPAPIAPILFRQASGLATVPLTAKIYNTGTLSNPLPFTVTFYSDAALQNPIGSAVVPASLQGCATRGATVSVTWKDLAPGVHPFWVVADSGGAVAENNETDNVASGVVTVYRGNRLMPLVLRQ